MQDVEFLALLVHRAHLSKEQAEGLFPAVQAGGSLDELLVERVGWEADKVEHLRRTRAGTLVEIPGFEVLAHCGTGGTADVFRAREKKTNRLLALKVLKPESTRHEGTRKAFVAEGRLLERLDHPSLIKGYGVARSGNVFFSKLALIEGRTVLEDLDADRRFTEEEALAIVLDVARALQYLEEEGVVHRDVKPGNVMLDASGRAILIDLGFAATAASGGAEAPGSTGSTGDPPTGNPEDSSVGTVAYLAPEQARGGADADCRSDIYSMGLSLFQIVVGRLPFDSSDDREVLRMQIMESLSSPELKGRGISQHLHYFIEKMVAKEADHRYQCWAELIEDVRGQLAGRESLDFEKDLRGRSSRRSARRPRR